mmetsp:Transcript_109140/g.338936  ORF Transcript_109140/g.338936 Transcript_109140/m.338936 type:complete len:80 (+) Transcript_109140:275-514(+)
MTTDPAGTGETARLLGGGESGAGFHAKPPVRVGTLATTLGDTARITVGLPGLLYALMTCAGECATCEGELVRVFERPRE